MTEDPSAVPPGGYFVAMPAAPLAEPNSVANEDAEDPWQNFINEPYIDQRRSKTPKFLRSEKGLVKVCEMTDPDHVYVRCIGMDRALEAIQTRLETVYCDIDSVPKLLPVRLAEQQVLVGKLPGGKLFRGIHSNGRILNMDAGFVVDVDCCSDLLPMHANGVERVPPRLIYSCRLATDINEGKFADHAKYVDWFNQLKTECTSLPNLTVRFVDFGNEERMGEPFAIALLGKDGEDLAQKCFEMIMGRKNESDQITLVREDGRSDAPSEDRMTMYVDDNGYLVPYIPDGEEYELCRMMASIGADSDSEEEAKERRRRKEKHERREIARLAMQGGCSPPKPAEPITFSSPQKRLKSFPGKAPRTEFSCLISAMESPLEFYVQKRPRDEAGLQRLRAELADFYPTVSAVDQREIKRFMEYVAFSRYEGSVGGGVWRRGILIQIDEERFYHFRCVDTGLKFSVGWDSVQDIKPLASCFQHPRYSIQCELEHFNGPRYHFNPEDTTKFQEFVDQHYENLRAEIVAEEIRDHRKSHVLRIWAEYEKPLDAKGKYLKITTKELCIGQPRPLTPPPQLDPLPPPLPGCGPWKQVQRETGLPFVGNIRELRREAGKEGFPIELWEAPQDGTDSLGVAGDWLEQTLEERSFILRNHLIKDERYSNRVRMQYWRWLKSENGESLAAYLQFMRSDEGRELIAKSAEVWPGEGFEDFLAAFDGGSELLDDATPNSGRVSHSPKAKTQVVPPNVAGPSRKSFQRDDFEAANRRQDAASSSRRGNESTGGSLWDLDDEAAQRILKREEMQREGRDDLSIILSADEDSDSQSIHGSVPESEYSAVVSIGENLNLDDAELEEVSTVDDRSSVGGTECERESVGSEMTEETDEEDETDSDATTAADEDDEIDAVSTAATCGTSKSCRKLKEKGMHERV